MKGSRTDRTVLTHVVLSRGKLFLAQFPAVLPVGPVRVLYHYVRVCGKICLRLLRGTLDPKSSVGGDAALLAYSRGDQATPQILFFLFPSISKPFLSFDESSFQTIVSPKRFSGNYEDTISRRSLRFCNGRALCPNIRSKFATCSALTSITSGKMNQCTPSLQGGVVSDPL